MFDNVAYLNRDQDTVRREGIEALFSKYNISAKRCSALQDTLQEFVLEPITSTSLSFPQTSCLISHLEIIRVYGNKDLLVFEDDADLTTMDYWPFSFEDVVQSLPEHVGIVQLFRHPPLFPAFARPWSQGVFGTVSYFIRPWYAEKLVSLGYAGGKWSIAKLKSEYPLPVADSVLYSNGVAMSINLFGSRDEGSTILPNAGYVKDAVEVSKKWKELEHDAEYTLKSIKEFK